MQPRKHLLGLLDGMKQEIVHPLNSIMTDLPDFDVVDDPIAEDKWSYFKSTGEATVARIAVGRPRPWSNHPRGDWLCPVQIDDFTEGVLGVAGVGPVDALMNAMALVKAFADQIGKFTPRAE